MGRSKPPVEPMRVWRARRGMSQGELAQAAGVTRQTVSNVERGASKPMPIVREAIARVLDTAPDSISEFADPS